MGAPLHTAHAYSMQWRMTAVWILFIAGGRMVLSRRRRIPIIRAQAVYTLETWSFHVRDSLPALAQGVCGCGLVGLEPLSLRQADSALPSFLSKDVCSLVR